jgi:hypothetical protein
MGHLYKRRNTCCEEGDRGPTRVRCDTRRAMDGSFVGTGPRTGPPLILCFLFYVWYSFVFLCVYVVARRLPITCVTRKILVYPSVSQNSTVSGNATKRLSSTDSWSVLASISPLPRPQWSSRRVVLLSSLELEPCAAATFSCKMTRAVKLAARRRRRPISSVPKLTTWARPARPPSVPRLRWRGGHKLE